MYSAKFRSSLRQSLADLKCKLDHNTLDLGIAAEKIENHENGEVKMIDPMEKLKCIRGHLVCFPLKFLWQEDLRPGFIESEFYAAPQVFHWYIYICLYVYIYMYVYYAWSQDHTVEDRTIDFWNDNLEW